MQTRRFLAPFAAAALAGAVIAGGGVANADEAADAGTGSLDLGSLSSGSADLDIPGVPNLSVSVDYKCVTTGDGDDAKTTAHIVTTVTNTGLGVANNVATFTHAPGVDATAAQHVASIEAGKSVTYELDAKTDKLAGTPVFAVTYASGLDTNPFDNFAVSTAPAGCAVPAAEKTATPEA